MEADELFARGVWACIPDEGDVSWVARVAALPASDEPLGDFGPLVKEMLDRGVSPHSIARFARIIGYETAFGVCALLDDPQAAYDAAPEVAVEWAWGLFRVDPESGKALEPMLGSHEILLSADPSGREMRPAE